MNVWSDRRGAVLCRGRRRGPCVRADTGPHRLGAPRGAVMGAVGPGRARKPSAGPQTPWLGEGWSKNGGTEKASRNWRHGYPADTTAA